MKSVLMVFAAALLLAGCGRRETRVEAGDRDQILHINNGTEPQDLDPHVVTGVPEHHLIMTLLEGLVSEDPRGITPQPGTAERWDISPDGTVYTFHLRKNARWSNGDPTTAHDFVRSFRRALTPSLASEYAYMLFVMKGAEDFNTGKITDFSQVGARAIDDHTLEIRLNAPTPYFLSLLLHYSWFPLHIPTIEKNGPLYERGNRWTKPATFVGNGPFALEAWKVNHVIIVRRNTNYWDAANVKIQKIHLYAIESSDTDERAFRSGQLHKTYVLPETKIDAYRKNHPDLLHIDPFLGTYFYMLNTTNPPLTDKRVRRALAMSIDREALVKNVTRGGQIPAYHFTPPGTAGYTARARFPFDIAASKKLLAEAGYPEEMPVIPIYFYTRVYAKRPSVKGVYPTILDNHPYHRAWLEPQAK